MSRESNRGPKPDSLTSKQVHAITMAGSDNLEAKKRKEFWDKHDADHAKALKKIRTKYNKRWTVLAVGFVAGSIAQHIYDRVPGIDVPEVSASQESVDSLDELMEQLNNGVLESAEAQTQLMRIVKQLDLSSDALKDLLPVEDAEAVEFYDSKISGSDEFGQDAIVFLRDLVMNQHLPSDAVKGHGSTMQLLASYNVAGEQSSKDDFNAYADDVVFEDAGDRMSVVHIDDNGVRNVLVSIEMPSEGNPIPLQYNHVTGSLDKGLQAEVYIASQELVRGNEEDAKDRIERLIIGEAQMLISSEVIYSAGN
jgi:hypothetical protein